MIFPTRRRLITCALVGMFSGGLSGAIINSSSSMGWVILMMFLPGTIFGVCIIFLFYYRRQNIYLVPILSVGFSTLAYHLSAGALDPFHFEGSFLLSMVGTGLAGMVGALTLGLSLVWLYNFEQKGIVIVLILLSGFICASLMPLIDLNKPMGLSIFHALWQAGAACSLSFGEISSTRASVPNNNVKAEPFMGADA